jgi:Meckel syndrome type 1 protein
MTPAQAAALAEDREAFASELEERPGPEVERASGERRTYRGRDLSEILPRIRAELGADAIVTHQREGLVGGIGGFFAQRFLEVEAIAAPAPQLDVYDGEDADPLAEIDGVVAMASPSDFAAQLATASPAAYETPALPTDHADPATVAGGDQPAVAAPLPLRAVAAPAPTRPALAPVDPRRYAPPAPASAMPPPPAAEPFPSLRPPSAFAHHELGAAWIAAEAREAAEFLIARGMSTHLTEELIGEARTHDLPFAGAGGMRDALHACIARRLPCHRGLPREGALIAIVGAGGSGKTRCAAALAATYAGASTLEVRAVSLGRYAAGSELSELVAPHGVIVQSAERGSRAAFDLASSRAGALVVADTPAVSPADPAGIGILGVELEDLRPEEVLVTLAATSNPVAARQMLVALAPLRPTGIILTHADETDQLGGAIEISLESALPLVFVHDGLELPGALRPAHPSMIAERLLS